MYLMSTSELKVLYVTRPEKCFWGRLGRFIRIPFGFNNLSFWEIPKSYWALLVRKTSLLPAFTWFSLFLLLSFLYSVWSERWKHGCFSLVISWIWYQSLLTLLPIWSVFGWEWKIQMSAALHLIIMFGFYEETWFHVLEKKEKKSPSLHYKLMFSLNWPFCQQMHNLPVWTVLSESPSEFSRLLFFFNGHVKTFNSRDEGFQPEEVSVHSVIHRSPRTAPTTAALVRGIEVDGGVMYKRPSPGSECVCLSLPVSWLSASAVTSLLSDAPPSVKTENQ